MMGFIAGVGLGLIVSAVLWTRRTRRTPTPSGFRGGDDHELADLLRRAHGAAACCIVREDGHPVVVVSVDPLPKASAERLASSARLVLADGRSQRLPDGVAAVSADTVAAAFQGLERPVDEAQIREDLRYFFALPSRETMEFGLAADIAEGVDTLGGVAFALAERAMAVADVPVAVVAVDAVAGIGVVTAISRGSDRRLVGMRLRGDSPVLIAARGETPLVVDAWDTFWGDTLPDRRREHRESVVYPMRSGGETVGAVVTLGSPRRSGEAVANLVARAAPRFAAAAAVRAAQVQSETDPLTGLPNRAALQRVLADATCPCAVLCVDLDHFKQLNDSLGHAAGDEALKHVAEVFREALRERDIPARIGGEEFALWLPGSDLVTAGDVAERVRDRVASGGFTWAGSTVPLSCSIGVAGCPETSSQVANLIPAGDAALYTAKRGGRNRVEIAVPAS